MKLFALVDFPDDALPGFTPNQVDEMMRTLSGYGVSRLYFQYYGNRDYGWCMNCDIPGREGCRATSERMPNYSRVFVKAAKKYGMETAAVMRPQEQSLWWVYPPSVTASIPTPGVPHIGGEMLGYSAFMKKHPDLRIKRRTWDLDPDAVGETVCMIKLYKQNDSPFRFSEKDITVYTSPDNSNYKPYTGSFTISESVEKAKETVRLSKAIPYAEEILTKEGDPIRVLTIGGISVRDRYIAVGVHSDSREAPGDHFINVPVHAIACFDENGKTICSTPGGTRTGTATRKPFLEEGFNFDDGFGAFQAITLDPDGDEGYFAIAKGKNEYVHGALCECEPEVREYWFSLLDQAMEDGYDYFGDRIECHSVHVDEPFAYGYNDCIKEEYFRRWGVCSEKDMKLSGISRIRGDAYSDIFREAARRVREKQKKTILTLNIKMLHDPIPLDRYYAYPMNVEWQWERWLEEIRPNEINFRMYLASIDFFLEDSQCRKMIETAKRYDVPMTVERYTYFDFVKEFDQIEKTGLFSAMTLYETWDLMKSNGQNHLELTEKGRDILPKLKQRLSHETGGGRR